MSRGGLAEMAFTYAAAFHELGNRRASRLFAWSGWLYWHAVPWLGTRAFRLADWFTLPREWRDVQVMIHYERIDLADGIALAGLNPQEVLREL